MIVFDLTNMGQTMEVDEPTINILVWSLDISTTSVQEGMTPLLGECFGTVT